MSEKEQHWLVESLRCTAFYDVSTEIDYTSWWSDVVGDQPDDIQQKPGAGAYRAKGGWHGASLSLTGQPGRVDWELAATPPRDDDRVVIPTAGDFSIVDEFTSLLNGWLQNSPEANRLAFGAVWLRPVEDHVDGCRQLDALLPNVTLDGETSRDFLYQINRRRDSSAVESAIINRVSKWSIIVATPVTIQIQGAGPSVATKHGGEVTAVRLEVDMNTAPESIQEIGGETAVSVFAELVGLGKEIASNGAIA